MHRSAPPALVRAHQRLAQRDAVGLVAERVSPAALLAGIGWLLGGPRRRLPRLHHEAPALAQLLDQVQVIRGRNQVDPMIIDRTLFGVGLIAGCHLRDAAEAGQPTPSTIDFDTALASLDTTELRSTLWSVGLPGDGMAMLQLVVRLAAASQKLSFRLFVGSDMAQALPRCAEGGTDGLLFLLGLFGAGIDLPNLRRRRRRGG